MPVCHSRDKCFLSNTFVNMQWCKTRITTKIHAPRNIKRKGQTNANYYNSDFRIWALKDEKELQVWIDEGKRFQSAMVCGKKEKWYTFERAICLDKGLSLLRLKILGRFLNITLGSITVPWNISYIYNNGNFKIHLWCTSVVKSHVLKNPHIQGSNFCA